MGDENQFRSVFKYYKKKQPPPSLDDVIDTHNSDHWDLFKEHNVTASFSRNTVKNAHFNKITEWKVGSFNATPGLVVMRNVFSSSDQMYWASKCLQEYSSDTFKRNIDHQSLNLSVGNWWEESQQDVTLVDKLRWSTLGYHHDWDTKVTGVTILSSLIHHHCCRSTRMTTAASSLPSSPTCPLK